MSAAVGGAAAVAQQRPSAARRARVTPVRVLVVVLAVGAVAMLLATSRYGIGLTPDSVVYVEGARSLADGHGFTAVKIEPGNTGASTTPITVFAPGYSAVLSIAERLDIDATTAARALAVVGFVAGTLLGYFLVCRYVRDKAAVIGATVVIGWSAVLLGVFDRALSEQLFLVDVVALLLVVTALRSRPASIGLLAAGVALVWVGFYLRYAGIVLLPYLVAVVLITSWRQSRPAALVRAAVAGTAGLVVPLAWMLRNVDAGSSAFGGRQDAAASPLTNAKRTVAVLGEWLSFSAPVAVGAVAVVAAGAFLTYLLVLYAQRSGTGWRSLTPLWPLALFVVGYVGYLVATASVVAFAAIDTRFLSPVFVPLVVVGAWAFEHALPTLAPRARRVMTGGVCLWVGLSVLCFAGVTIQSARHGAGGYATKRWAQSQLMRDVRGLAPASVVFSNDPRAVELFTGREVLLSPQRVYFNSNEATAQLPAFIRDVACSGPVTLAWFEPNPRSYLYSIADLERHVHLAPRLERSDGVIYDVSPLPSAGAPNCPTR